ncbi:octopamine receptor beta-3R-like [Aricia agestis]|uniref:octopamine receptor beta-3R-like n=1 Tax=Aricia agestis TaxID=91739 RepID=UPI001C201616|nr:octopamine receptor beta-3R-like [Aricia agestis]
MMDKFLSDYPPYNIILRGNGSAFYGLEDVALRGEVEGRGRGTEALHELHSTLPPAAPDAWHTVSLVLKGLVFITIILGALFGNALVIISVHRHRKLRVITNYYVVSLAVADMLVALCAMTFNASAELTDSWLFGPLVCDIFNSLDVYFSSASILHLCCISVDRYYAIVRPLEYPVTMTHRTVCFMLANVWLWPAFISFVPIFMGWYTTEEHRQYRKIHPDECIFKTNMVYSIISSSVSFWIPSLVMISMYCKIFREAVRQREALTRTSSNVLLNSVHIKHTSHSAHHSHYLHPDRRPSDISPNYSTFTEVGPEEADIGGEVMIALGDICPSKEASPRKSVNVSCDTASSGYCSGGSNKRSSSSGQPPPPGWRPSCTSTVATKDFARACTELNNQGATLRAAGKSWRAEHKAARTLGIIVGAFLLCWLPFFLWYVTSNVCGEPCETPPVVVGVLFWIGYFNSALNPLIYAYFNRDFRDAFKNTLMCALPCCFSCWKDPGTASFV